MARKPILAKSSSTPPIPKPNLSHPQNSKILKIIKSKQHQHSSSYHSFISSPYYPTSNSSSSNGKKRPASSTSGEFPELVENSIEVKILNDKVLNWFESVKESRGMPWRRDVIVGEGTREERSQRGYEVWVSEIMLQQTQVATVIAYWNKWMLTFPTVSDLANADIEEVNKVWAGLGYYSRASRLLAGAKTVMNSFDGFVPETVAELEKIDGIGPYSAGAISSIAYCARSPVVDGNVTRVLSRLTAVHALSTAKATTNYIWALADLLVPLSRPSTPTNKSTGKNKSGAWNQALMELGATICTPKNPSCFTCPLSEECLAYAEIRTANENRSPPPPKKNFFDLSKPKILVVAEKKEKEEEVEDLEDLCTLCTPFDPTEKSEEEFLVTRYPMAKLAKKSREEETAVCVVEWESSEVSTEKSKGGRKILVFKRPEKGLLAGLFDFPSLDLSPESESTSQIRTKQITNLLSSLLVDKIPSASTSSSKPAVETPLTVSMRKELASVTQVYSHQKRQYHIQRLVLSSPSLPLLKPSLPPSSSSSSAKGKDKATTKEEDFSHSLPGRGKWVDELNVLESNIGGAMIKVWEVRQGGKGDNGATVKKGGTAKKNSAGGGNGKNASEAGSSKGKGKKLDRYETSEEEEEEAVESDEAESSDVEVVEEVKDDAEKVPYKKRRIVISDNEEED